MCREGKSRALRWLERGLEQTVGPFPVGENSALPQGDSAHSGSRRFWLLIQQMHGVENRRDHLIIAHRRVDDQVTQGVPRVAALSSCAFSRPLASTFGSRLLSSFHLAPRAATVLSRDSNRLRF